MMHGQENIKIDCYSWGVLQNVETTPCVQTFVHPSVRPSVRLSVCLSVTSRSVGFWWNSL